MSVAPIAMLRDVYGNAVSYALVGARTSAAPGMEQSASACRPQSAGIRQYLNDLAWRTTPLTGLGLPGSLLLALRSSKDAPGNSPSDGWSLTLCCWRRPLCFFLGSNVDPSHRIHPYELRGTGCASGLAVARGWAWLSGRFALLGGWAISTAALAALLTLQLTFSVTAFPYYISYYNPVVEAPLPAGNPKSNIE